MSAVPTVEVDGNDLTDYVQHRSMSVKRNSVDVTFIDPSDPIALGDSLVVTDPAWTGTVVSVESSAFDRPGTGTEVPFMKVRASNTAIIPNSGSAPYNLSDASLPAKYKNLTVSRTRNGTTDEVRAECIVFVEGLEIGQEILLTSAIEGYSAETFTIMDITTEWPTHDDEATYALALGLGAYEDAMTGAADGGPLDRIQPGGRRGAIVQVVRNAGGCMDCPDGGGPCSEVVIEDFEDRTGLPIDGSWGLTNGWQTFIGSGANAQVYVSAMPSGWPGGGDHIVGALIRPPVSGGVHARTIVGVHGAWNESSWTIRWLVGMVEVFEAGPVLGVITDSSGSATIQLGGDHFHISDVVDDSSAEAAFDFFNNEPYYVQMHYVRNVILEAKVWIAGDTEPAYMVNGIPTMVNDLSSYLYVGGPSAQASDRTFEVDEIRKMCPA